MQFANILLTISIEWKQNKNKEKKHEFHITETVSADYAVFVIARSGSECTSVQKFNNYTIPMETGDAFIHLLEIIMLKIISNNV